MPFAHPQEARDFLERHPEVRSIELMLIDANGIPRGKLLHRDELLAWGKLRIFARRKAEVECLAARGQCVCDFRVWQVFVRGAAAIVGKLDIERTVRLDPDAHRASP